MTSVQNRITQKPSNSQRHPSHFIPEVSGVTGNFWETQTYKMSDCKSDGKSWIIPLRDDKRPQEWANLRETRNVQKARMCQRRWTGALMEFTSPLVWLHSNSFDLSFFLSIFLLFCNVSTHREGRLLRALQSSVLKVFPVSRGLLLISSMFRKGKGGFQEPCVAFAEQRRVVDASHVGDDGAERLN